MFASKIPHEIGNLCNLDNLGTDQNSLIGVVPYTIFNISTLNILSLSSNTLSGILPPSPKLIGLSNIERVKFATECTSESP